MQEQENNTQQELEMQNSADVPDAEYTQVNRRWDFSPVFNQGCSTFICGIIILIVVVCKIRNISFQNLTSKWIDYGNQEQRSNLEIKIFPTEDSYTAIVLCNGIPYVVNCASNFKSEEVQNYLDGLDPEILFLVSDATDFLNAEPKAVYATSQFSKDYYNSGEFTEKTVGLPDGKLEIQLKDDTLRFHYTKDGDTVFSVHFNIGKPHDKCDVLINSDKTNLKTLAKKTYLDNNNSEKFNLKDYKEITIDLINKKVYAD